MRLFIENSHSLRIWGNFKAFLLVWFFKKYSICSLPRGLRWCKASQRQWTVVCGCHGMRVSNGAPRPSPLPLPSSPLPWCCSRRHSWARWIVAEWCGRAVAGSVGATLPAVRHVAGARPQRGRGQRARACLAPAALHPPTSTRTAARLLRLRLYPGPARAADRAAQRGLSQRPVAGRWWTRVKVKASEANLYGFSS